jgi:GDPmannose 4,6-dehydratase
MTKRALIFGISGQDGRWLSKQLADKGYEVIGFLRRPPTVPPPFEFYIGDLTSFDSVYQVISQSHPDEIYNLAAMSHVGQSYADPNLAYEVTGLGACNVLRATWQYMLRYRKDVKVYQASSSEMFGTVDMIPQNEDTPFAPVSPYACAKVLAHQVACMYRKMGMKAWCGILFNHESEYRPTTFVTTKIARAAARKEYLCLGNIDTKRDWGYTPEYTMGMWQMLQSDKPEDFVLATGETHTVQEFLEEAYRYAGIPDWRKFVTIDPSSKRPLEAGPLEGDATKAWTKLGWLPKTRFVPLVHRLVDYFGQSV